MRNAAPHHIFELLAFSCLASLAACGAAPAPSQRESAQQKNGSMSNPVFHFEVPVTDMDRAMRFYETVFAIKMRRERVDGYDMAFFPRLPGEPGASGALAKGDAYIPSRTGPILYFD